MVGLIGFMGFRTTHAEPLQKYTSVTAPVLFVQSMGQSGDFVQAQQPFGPCVWLSWHLEGIHTKPLWLWSLSCATCGAKQAPFLSNVKLSQWKSDRTAHIAKILEVEPVDHEGATPNRYCKAAPPNKRNHTWAPLQRKRSLAKEKVAGNKPRVGQQLAVVDHKGKLHLRTRAETPV